MRRKGGVQPPADALKHFVYFLEDEATGLVKIGYTFKGHLPTRIRTLEREVGHPLTLRATAPGDRRIEQGLHVALLATRAHGEWFHPSPDLAALIEQFSPPIRITRVTPRVGIVMRDLAGSDAPTEAAS
jgi:hypothetical protein